MSIPTEINGSTDSHLDFVFTCLLLVHGKQSAQTNEVQRAYNSDSTPLKS